jgi:hypothetical protein
MLCLEVWKERSVDEEGKESRGEGNDYLFPLFGCFKN